MKTNKANEQSTNHYYESQHSYVQLYEQEIQLKFLVRVNDIIRLATFMTSYDLYIGKSRFRVPAQTYLVAYRPLCCIATDTIHTHMNAES